MLLAAWFVPSLLSLSALKSRALRKGVWFRLDPAARALVDATLLYLKRGGVIKSPALINALRAVAERIMAMTSPLRVLARAVGMAIARARGIQADEERAVALGLQWINTPKRYKNFALVEP
ncbi:hypothetical protein [Pyrobaculum aerophilum]|uniref:hypothetical protein n=1 Tax=Pyrobaculum aerophilum TaxID=13773 RepID=UPI0023EF8EA1|nr:hypothetical protein [Pyrobaculum aerophilum]MCX8136383.1 hypothetical protein [Pyrobaculum aerophilum]